MVAHENAHMWFGDLVTMEWWNGLWLNEAFATFMEMLAVDAWKPAVEALDQLSASRGRRRWSSTACTARGRSSSPCEARRTRDAMFDVLTYEKGASVLRMLEQYLGAERFRSGIESAI